MRNKHRYVASITQNNEARHIANRKNVKPAKRQSARMARVLDQFVIDEQIIDAELDIRTKSKKHWIF